MSENKNGVVLTAGARGRQTDGTEWPKACIPPSCILSIRDKQSGDAIPRARLFGDRIVLREAERRPETAAADAAAPEEADAGRPSAGPRAVLPVPEGRNASPRAAIREEAAPDASSRAAPPEDTRREEGGAEAREELDAEEEREMDTGAIAVSDKNGTVALLPRVRGTDQKGRKRFPN